MHSTISDKAIRSTCLPQAGQLSTSFQALSNKEHCMKKIYVGNLPFSATEEQVREVFGKHGVVHGVSLVNDRETDRFRGFCYVEIEDDALGQALKLDGKAFDGRPMKVTEAVEESPDGGES
jgi:RNA recognition motif-containing protein